MAFRALIGIATAIALYVTPASAQECYDRDDFFNAVKGPDTVIMMANSGAAKKIVAQLNDNRVKNGSVPVDGHSVAIGLIDEGGGRIKVGVAIFDLNGCVIPDTVAVLTLDQWASFTVDAGVTADDFAKLQDM